MFRNEWKNRASGGSDGHTRLGGIVKTADGKHLVPGDAGRYEQRVLATPPKDRALIRPTLVDLQDGTYLVLAEQWNWKNPASDGTLVMRINAKGEWTGEGKMIGNHRLHASNDAFLLPKCKQVAWVAGDAVNNARVLTVMDANFAVRTVRLSLP